MDATLAPQEAWDQLSELVREGDKYAIKTWLEYRFGKPKETKDVTIVGDQPVFNIDVSGI